MGSGVEVMSMVVFVAGLFVLAGAVGAMLWVLNSVANPNRMFSYILALPWLWFVANYPVRALVLGASDAAGNFNPPLGEQEILVALAYASLFFFLLCVTTIWVSKLRTPILQYYRVEEIWMCRAFFAIAIVSFCFRIAAGRIYGLNSSEEDLKTDFMSNLLLSLDTVKWLALVSATALGLLTRKREFIVMAATTAILILTFSILAASKGAMVQLVLIYLLFKGILGIPPNKKLLSTGVLIAITYSGFSYMQRQYAIVSGNFDFYLLIDSLDEMFNQIDNENFDTLIDLTVGSVANRLNYLDALVLAMRKFGEIANPLYQFGGFSELLNIIPRFIWESRPNINFNMYLTEFVWGIPGLVSETPIGRIGESVLVLGWAGLVLAPVYGAIFGMIGKVFSGSQSPTRLAVYVTILVNFVWPDAHGVFLWKALVTILIVVWVVQYFVRFFVRPENRRVVMLSANTGR
jgi:hypothetical protein